MRSVQSPDGLLDDDLPVHPSVRRADVEVRSGVGERYFTLQLARLLGARVIATTSTAEKAERLRALGASDVINYTETPDWDAKVRELTDGRGVDCVVEIGGPGTIAMSLQTLAVGGHISLIGASLSPSGIASGKPSVVVSAET